MTENKKSGDLRVVLVRHAREGDIISKARGGKAKDTACLDPTGTRAVAVGSEVTGREEDEGDVESQEHQEEGDG